MESGPQGSKCPDEPDFIKLYDVLGDRGKQDEIRKSNPDVKHCSKLIMSPTACDGCPKNPLKGKDKTEIKDRVLMLKYQRLIERILILYDYVDLGLIRDLSELNPLECSLIRVIHQYYRSRRTV